ncbi:hypothetical protein GUJ93_ZPchr0013g34294 [Zizania palustris]|uniref:Uncharacterized protein n=1 Tax=Zizania palustris TaxID=103762 RepID=A0A8J5WXW4_ZIZPA|nr:hypothetical protein GUJ93_ZPchr0013g34294 [Zizania palustris]
MFDIKYQQHTEERAEEGIAPRGAAAVGGEDVDGRVRSHLGPPCEVLVVVRFCADVDAVVGALAVYLKLRAPRRTPRS